MHPARTRIGLRVVGCDVRGLRGREVGALSGLIKPLAADVVVVAGAPWRIRARTRGADLAARLGLYYQGGGAESVGNLVLVSLRVQVHESWSVQFPLVPGHLMRAAVLARCTVPGGEFVVVGTELAGAGPSSATQRSAQAGILARVLSDVDAPVVLVGNVAGTVLADDRVDATAPTGGSAGPTGGSAGPNAIAGGSILVGPGISVQARHYARRGSAVARLPIMADLLLPG